MTKDALGTRMKSNYELRHKVSLPRRTYILIRLDGRAFHSYCKGLTRPFDADLSTDMGSTAIALCREIQGARFAYVQSDEISILVTDFASDDTEAWFDNNLQKMVSVSASIATAEFNRERSIRCVIDQYRNTSVSMEMVRKIEGQKLAHFDSRAFVIPDRTEVENYFIWRQQDCTRNSISMAAQSMFPHWRLQGQSSDQMQELMFQAQGVNWNDYPEVFKRGQVIRQHETMTDLEYVDKRTQERKLVEGVVRKVWASEAPPVFTREREYLDALIPRYA